MSSGWDLSKNWEMLSPEEYEKRKEFVRDPSRKADYVLYWNIQIASMWLKENNIDYRVTSIDGRSMVATDDFQAERANFKLVNDRIQEITYG